MIKLALVDIFVDQGQILKDDPAGAENHMADFRVAHLPAGKPTSTPDMDRREFGIIRQQARRDWAWSALAMALPSLRGLMPKPSKMTRTTGCRAQRVFLS